MVVDSMEIQYDCLLSNEDTMEHRIQPKEQGIREEPNQNYVYPI